jgi:hypothetical protein
MNFFGVLISDAQWEAAMAVARSRRSRITDQKTLDAAIRKALGFDPIIPEAVWSNYYDWWPLL